MTSFAERGFGSIRALSLGVAVTGLFAACGREASNVSTHADGGTLTFLTTGQASPGALAIDDSNVYWFNLGTNDSTGKVFGGWSDGAVMRCNIGGCANAPTTLASARTQGEVDTPLAFAVNDGNVFWSDDTPMGGVGGDTGHILKCSVLGCANKPELVGASEARSLAANDENLFWTQFAPDVLSCPVSGCNAAPTIIWTASASSLSVGIVVDAVDVYWSVATGEILRCSVGGCQGAPTVVMSSDAGIGAPKALAADVNNIYFTNANPLGLGQILSCAKSGCAGPPTVIASGLNSPTAIATDGTSVYWAETGNSFVDGAAQGGTGLVRKCAVTGCGNTPTTIAAGLEGPTAVAVDGRNVYWAEAGNGPASGRISVAPK